MYFDLTEDQKVIADTVGALLAKAVPDSEIVQQFDRGSVNRDLWSSLAEMGLCGILVSEEHGGIGMDLLTLAVVQEQLGQAAAPVPVAANALAAWLLSASGDATLRERWVAPLLAGEAIAAFAIEKNGQSDPEAWTQAPAALSGSLGNILWAAEADLLIVGCEGGELALIETTAAGVTVEPVEAVDRSQPLGHVRFDGAVATRIEGSTALATRLCDALFVLSAADACGAGNRAMDLAVEYATTRKQFDRLIGSFQGLKHQLANMKAEMEPVRYLYWYAAHCWDALPAKASYTASLAKAHASDVAVRVARAAVEAHGGIGYTWEYPLHIYLKRAMTARAIHGLPSIHRSRSAALAGW
ncbi:acyl-CoA dehydrogenase family protein [Sphingopyxis sp.]|uniref:acyl-CoA dehydrogenase family protein n=1 Tax=Sphingopyxis sp. TaxID=1908224 RepID=UPI003D6D77D6